MKSFKSYIKEAQFWGNKEMAKQANAASGSTTTMRGRDEKGVYTATLVRKKGESEHKEVSRVYDTKEELELDEATWEEVEVEDDTELNEVAAWQRKEGKSPTGGLNKKGIASYRRENPGSKLSMAVTTKPSKLKKGSKAWNRRKSFCARMGGMPGPMKDEKGRPTRKALSLRKWNC